MGDDARWAAATREALADNLLDEGEESTSITDSNQASACYVAGRCAVDSKGALSFPARRYDASTGSYKKYAAGPATPRRMRLISKWVQADVTGGTRIVD